MPLRHEATSGPLVEREGDGLGLKVPLLREPAAERIEFAVVRRDGATSGRVRISGTVRNRGTMGFRAAAGQVAVVLYEGDRVLARRDLTTLDPGASLTISAEVACKLGASAPTYTLHIAYDAALLSDASPDNDDAVTADNRVTRDGRELHALLRAAPVGR